MIAIESSRPAVPSAPPDQHRLYVLTRRDLSWSQRIVQATHAATQLVFTHHDMLAGSWGPLGPAMVLFGVRDEEELFAWYNHLGVSAVPFYEPDREGELTAVAYWGAYESGFSELRLL